MDEYGSFLMESAQFSFNWKYYIILIFRWSKNDYRITVIICVLNITFIIQDKYFYSENFLKNVYIAF